MVGGFYPRAREGRDNFSKHELPPMTCFYPRAREGRDAVEIEELVLLDVSIRAPVKDATVQV